VLALPFAFKATGYALGAIILVLFGLVSLIYPVNNRILLIFFRLPIIRWIY